MSKQRLPYETLLPSAYKAMNALSMTIHAAGIGKQLIDLVFLRVSQVNGCAYCIDMHARDLLAEGESWQRINSLVGWQETTFYSERERAALAWAEAVTLIAGNHAPDALFDALKAHFSDVEITELTYAVTLMNAWNRLAIAFRKQVKPAELAQPAR
ncbi:carboxymuconolactone decarboxylase family protein [Collimonas silvisoli]|uniref:carboxymuconolactone decarboxylase family protein n=1 Tax=Collimonas silvisoli TaxID=2825884 RepID=UPI001B8C232A|nr:carboxymuconolactone decarboxylase family protein [Collimonas silvisoli]